MKRRHRDGALAFAGAYAVGAFMGGTVLASAAIVASKNPRINVTPLVVAGLSLFVPVLGPVGLGAVGAGGYTVLLAQTKDSTGLAVGIVLAPFAYAASIGAIVDGVMQGVCLSQALGWSDPERSPSGASRAAAGWRAARSVFAVEPMVLPPVRAPFASADRGLPTAMGVALPGRW
ncbi:MAG: hypothetical protein HOO96_03375 [Polyangiaceae bacterium]|nr:hypothetical protein [Polyangiaceae bacterium]